MTDQQIASAALAGPSAEQRAALLEAARAHSAQLFQIVSNYFSTAARIPADETT